MCQIVVMKREISRILGVLAALVCFAHAARAQLQGGADWDIDGQRFGSRSGGGSAVPSAARDANLEQLNKILSVSQLTPTDRSAYLSLRAFALARAGREADGQKDVAEMGKVLPAAWQIVMWSTMPIAAEIGRAHV